jgi:hypothetical protein
MVDTLVAGLVGSFVTLVVTGIFIYSLRKWIIDALLMVPATKVIGRIDESPFDRLGIDWSRELKAGDQVEIRDRLILGIKLTDHGELWDGFVGKYYAINAPWVVETEAEKSYAEAVAIQTKRYSDAKCQAVYIFYDRGHERAFYPDAHKGATKFWKAMDKLDPKSLDQISVITAGENAPNYTIFIGSKPIGPDGKERLVSIIYIGEWPFTHDKGSPNWSFVCFDQSLNKIIIEECVRLEKNYKDAKVSAADFISRMPSDSAAVATTSSGSSKLASAQ